MNEKIIKETLNLLKGTGYLNAAKVFISVPDAERHLRDGIKYFCGPAAVWRDEYRPIADWLSGNNGKGLLVWGNYGTGKTLIAGKIIPVILCRYCNRLMCMQYRATDINRRLEEICRQKIIYIDDLGMETRRNDYGNKDVAFCELVDVAEREGKMLIASTNLSYGMLTQKYGERTMDRLRGLTKLVTFNGKSLRQ